MQVNFDGHDVTWPYNDYCRLLYHASRKMCLDSHAHLHTGENGRLPSNLNATTFFEAWSKKDVLLFRSEQ